MSPRLKTGSHSQATSGTPGILPTLGDRPVSPQLANASQIRSRGAGENFFPFVRSMWDDTFWSSRTVAGWARKTMPAKIDPEVEAQMALAWKDEAHRHAGGRCAACGYEGRYLEVHHVLSQSVIRREFRKLGRRILPALLWDFRNSMVLCDEPAPNRCHTRHTNAFDRVPRERLTEAHYEFARELDSMTGDERFTVRLENDYPAQMRRAA